MRWIDSYKEFSSIMALKANSNFATMKLSGYQQRYLFVSDSRGRGSHKSFPHETCILNLDNSIRKGMIPGKWKKSRLLLYYYHPTSGLMQILHFDWLCYHRSISNSHRVAKFAKFAVFFPNKYIFFLQNLLLLLSVRLVG